jgi:uncharacterized membrane protein
MKFFPTSDREWLRFMAMPFEVFLFAYGIFYPFWLFSAPSHPGTLRGPDASVLTGFTIGCLFACLVLFIIAVAQAVTKNRRDAFWSLGFAVVAFCLAAVGLFQPAYR